MAEKLKHCPFCGGEAELYIMKNSEGNVIGTEVFCRVCYSHGPFNNAKVTVEIWNSRVNNGTIDIATLEAKLRKYADKKCNNGEIELANGILKAVSFIKEEFKEDKQ